MKPEKILDAIGRIDDDMLVSAEQLRNGSNNECRKRVVRMEKKKRWLRNGLLAAAAIIVAGICLFASRFSLNEMYPVQLGTEEMSSEMEEITEEEMTFSQEETLDETEGEAENLPQQGVPRFEAAQSMVDYGEYRFYADGMTELQYSGGTKLCAAGADGEKVISEQLESGLFAASSNMLYYLEMDEKMHRLVGLNMDTLEKEELYVQAVETLESGEKKTFSLRGIIGEYLIFSEKDWTGYLYSYLLKDGTVAALSSGYKTDLNGIGEYMISVGSESPIPGIIETSVLTIDKLDGSESWEIADFYVGATIKDDILYYIEWIDGEQYLIGYDIDERKELSSQVVSTEGKEWGYRNDCFYRGWMEVLFTDGSTHEYSGWVFKVEDKYFTSGLGISETDQIVYCINEDGSLKKVENLDFESELGISDLSLHNGRVYMVRKMKDETEFFSWEQSVFEIE